MSTCISHHGEYGSHTLDGEGFYCTRCGDLDDVALVEQLRAKDAEIARLVGADRENYALTAEVQVLREENERLRSLVRKLYDARVRLLSDGASPERAAFQLADGELDTLNAALDGEKEPTDAEG